MGAARRAGVVAIVALIGGALLLAGCGHNRAASQRPNVIVVMTDDQTADSLWAMPAVRRLIFHQGVTFTRAFASYPLCCPSRATFLTGQYAHNNGVQGNDSRADGGGYPSLRHPGRNLAAWLRDAGYETAHVGRWLNDFPHQRAPPPGWSRWRGELSSHRYYHSIFYRPHGSRRLGEGARDYEARVVTRLATRFIEHTANDDRPFFLSLGYLGPHNGPGRDDVAGRRCDGVTSTRAPAREMAQPDPRDARAFLHRPIARPPSFNEGDVTDKPYFLRRPPLSEAGKEEIVRLYRCGLASLRSVDRGVRRLVGELKRTAQLAHTVILFTSDQGLMAGQHRLPGGKDYPYEEAIRIPLAIRGPGIPHRARVRDLVANPDFVPTILDLAGIEHPDEGARPTDGRSLVPLLSGTSGWRERAVLIEGRFHTAPSRGGGFKAVSYDGVRSRRYLYVEWHLATAASHRAASHAALGAGRVVARELYDLAVDPYETQNRNADERYARARHRLSRIVDHLKDCGGSSCQVDRPIPPPSG